jgi:hypothetical protein
MLNGAGSSYGGGSAGENQLSCEDAKICRVLK